MARGIAWWLEYYLETALISVVDWVAAYPLLTTVVVVILAGIFVQAEPTKEGEPR